MCGWKEQTLYSIVGTIYQGWTNRLSLVLVTPDQLISVDSSRLAPLNRIHALVGKSPRLNTPLPHPGGYGGG